MVWFPLFSLLIVLVLIVVVVYLLLDSGLGGPNNEIQRPTALVHTLLIACTAWR